MQTHPDADAFMRSYLEQPTDATARLVFADWLEETGEAHNTAWAHYIRLKIEADHHEPGSPERRELYRQADEYAPQIRARLTISAKLFVGYPKSLLQLLPGPNITVRLNNFEVARPVLELVPESVARENFVLPLDAQWRTLLVAGTDPCDLGTVQKLEFILNRDVVFVRAAFPDILDAINREYGQTETESVDSALVAFADTPSPFAYSGYPTEIDDLSPAAARLVNLIVREAIRVRADRILITPEPNGIGVRYRIDDEWTERDRFPARLLRQVTTRIAIMSSIFIGNIYGASVGSLPQVGEVLMSAHGVQFSLNVTIQPSPDGPTTQIDITREPVT
jgi:uncharacterized protein (TIGR02996 family)